MRARGSVEPQDEATQNTNEEKIAPPRESRLVEPAPETTTTRHVSRAVLVIDTAETPFTLSDEAGTPAVGSAPVWLEENALPTTKAEGAAPVVENTQPQTEAPVGLSALALVGFLSFYQQTHRPSRKEDESRRE